MPEKIIITDLDFESIKDNLKTFLNSQQQFLDYNFEGSGLSVLINLLAYNTYYNAFYANMMANELFIDSAQVRNSLLSHAKSLNYTPISRRAPTAIVNVVVTPPGGNTQSLLTMDRFTEFQSQAIDGVNHTFVAKEAVSVYKEAGVFTFSNLEIKAGTPQVATFTYSSISNPATQFELPNDDIDTSTLLVQVQASTLNTATETFQLSVDITEITSNSAVYYLSPSTDDKYRLTFGDGSISRALANGNIVIASYLSTDGADANKANLFATGAIGGFSNVSISSVSSASGGAEREGDDSIRARAPMAYTAQNRAVTQKDYETLLKQLYPDIQSIFVWGGEDNVPPVYGKVYVSISPKEGVIINEAEKSRIVAEILGPVSVLSITPVLVDPDYVYMKFEAQVEVDGKLTLLTTAQISETVRQAIITYTNDTFNQFGTIFTVSKFSRAVDDSLSAILGSDTIVRLEKRLTPTFNTSTTYTVNFGTELHHAPIQRAMKSTAFTTYDSSNVLRTAYIEEVYNSSTGVDSIEIADPGYGYTDPPTITITGDGSGAVAVATIVNGRIDTITTTKRGTNYTSALVTLSGGGGQGGSATAVVQSKFGTLRSFYYNSNSEKVDINPELGTINYFTGEVVINNLSVVESLTETEDIRISVEPGTSIIETKRNQLLLLDTDDPTAISISVVVR